VPSDSPDIDAAVQDLYSIGVSSLKQGFSREWVDRMREDIDIAFDDAVQRDGGAVGRGPHRFYVEIHPQQFRGFVDLMTHPWVEGVCEAVLGNEWKIVEVGFDIPFAGAADQPWHRDFPSPRETYEDRRLTSLAFNLTAVDTITEMGPLEVAEGTQWEEGRDFVDGMFPPREQWPRYEAVARPKLPRMGDVSVRSALTVHRGTANRSTFARPVLVVGVDAPGAGHDALHDPMVTPDYWDRLPSSLRDHLHCSVVDVLVPITQKHQIEGLVDGV
jgi:hypothetical protein